LDKRIGVGTDKLKISPASEPDIPLLLTFIKELAVYEDLLDNVSVTEERLRTILFGKTPRANAVIGYCNDLPVAFAIYFFNVSSFDGRPGLYIEDIFVRPPFRRSGIGRKLFAFLSQRAAQEGCGRIELSVLDWNEPAMKFYTKLGGTPVNDWIVFRFSEQAINALT
jgi:GNAT superfamily N-acetyltransferase